MQIKAHSCEGGVLFFLQGKMVLVVVCLTQQSGYMQACNRNLLRLV